MTEPVWAHRVHSVARTLRFPDGRGSASPGLAASSIHSGSTGRADPGITAHTYAACMSKDPDIQLT